MGFPFDIKSKKEIGPIRFLEEKKMENLDNYTLRNRRKRASGSYNTEENVGNKRHAHTSVGSNYESKMSKSNEILDIQCVAAMMHQGSKDFSELTRGRQCVANALASIAFKSLPGKDVEKWDSDDLLFCFIRVMSFTDTHVANVYFHIYIRVISQRVYFFLINF